MTVELCSCDLMSRRVHAADQKSHHIVALRCIITLMKNAALHGIAASVLMKQQQIAAFAEPWKQNREWNLATPCQSSAQ
jgi:hypothetical protein